MDEASRHPAGLRVIIRAAKGMKDKEARRQVLAGQNQARRYHSRTFMCKAGTSIFVLVWLIVVAGCKHYQARDLSSTRELEQLESRTLQDAGLEAFLQTNSPATLERTRSGQWDLDSLTWAAVYFHPSIQVAWAQWQVAQAA